MKVTRRQIQATLRDHFYRNSGNLLNKSVAVMGESPRGEEWAGLQGRLLFFKVHISLRSFLGITPNPQQPQEQHSPSGALGK